VLQKKKTTGKSVRQKNETHPCALLPTQHNTTHNTTTYPRQRSLHSPPPRYHLDFLGHRHCP
jgi:hypothetical protein